MIFDCFEEENVLRRSMMANSSKSVFLCDSTKFGRTAPFKLCSLNEVDYIVSDYTLKDYFKVDVKTKFLSL